MLIKFVYLYSDNNKQKIETMNKVIKIKGNFVNGYTKRSNNSAYVMTNSLGQFGYLPNESNPYMPIGGRKALLSVESILIFK